MLLIEAIAERIVEIKDERRLSQYSLSKLTGIPQSTISTIIKKQIKTIKLSTIYDLCSGLGIELREFFNSPIFELNSLDD